MAKRDVAWGFFYHEPITSEKRASVHMAKDLAAIAHEHYRQHFARVCGPIFRITPPKPKRRGRGK